MLCEPTARGILDAVSPPRIALMLLVATLGTGCGDGGGPAATTVDAGADAVVALPDQPAPPMRPVLTPCATGWREVSTIDGPTTCEPWPESGHADCTSIDEAHFPGTPGCSRIGPECPAGDFPEGLPAGTPVRYVLATAAPGGDGSIDRPFATVTAALVGVPTATIVAVGKGSYDEAFNVPGGVTIWGACVAQTMLHASTPGTLTYTPVVGFLRAGGALRNVRIGAGPRQAIFLDGRSSSATVDAVEIDGGGYTGIAANGGHLVLHDVVVRDMGSRGLEVVEGATTEAIRVVVERTHEIGAFVAYGATLRLEDSVIRAVLPTAGGTGGMGVDLQDGSALEALRLVIEDVHDVGILALGASSFTLADSVVRDVQERASDHDSGNALSIEAGSNGNFTRVLVERSTENGVFALGVGTTVDASDVVVRDMLGHPGSGTFGRGITSNLGAVLTMERAWVERARELGVFVAGLDAHATFTDLTVLDTGENGEGAGGRGLSLQEEGAAAEVVRGDFVRNREIGVAAHPGTTLRLTDVAIRDTAGRTSDGTGGDALTIYNSDVEGTRVLIERSNGFGAIAIGESANARFSQLTVRDSVPRSCVGPACGGAQYGVGVGSVAGATLSASDFAIVHASVCGALVAEGSALDLARGQVRQCQIGACIQSTGFDTARLAAGVIYAENERNLDTTSLPAPTALPPL